MKLRDLIGETFLSLTANKARSFLTVLGIVVGITSVIVLVSIGQGTRASIEASISSAGSNLLTVFPGGEGRFFGGGGGGGSSTLTLQDANAIRSSVVGVSAVAPVISNQYTVIGGANNESVSVYGTTNDYQVIRSVTMTQGAWFTQGDQAGAGRVAVIGPTTSENLFGQGSNPVGQTIRVNGQPFTVIGVMASKGSSGFQNQDDVVIVPLRSMQQYLSGGGNTVSTIYVQASTQAAMTNAESGINTLLLSRHKITDSTQADFRVLSQADLASTASTVTTTLTIFLGAIAGISLLVGGIGIMNMMLTTVTERIREIGLRKAIGATRSDITSQFLAEAVALTVTGGLIGIVLGWGISSAISALITSIHTQVTLGSVLLAVGVSTGIGLVFGYYPARRAAKLNPIEALRYQ